MAASDSQELVTMTRPVSRSAIIDMPTHPARLVSIGMTSSWT